MKNYLKLVRILPETAEKAREIRKYRRIFAEQVFKEAVDLLHKETFGKTKGRSGRKS